ncbi:chromosome segregation protein SMC [Roseivivax halodurans JCM 10272]|uniref:Chromosome segregation protein SMC n=1 Tax=Roseivivax halodurans JCM 10272 TaxID=1449350 RepID=X7EKF8_9RHOB|nr:chromosome segregation protein SMC [Roseivivax halodurans]ETX16584.1 chromosome segregation protein SMC [Roseivivax halodurans JCM 10272]
MRLRAIEVNNVRRFTAAARVEGITDGLNVLCEPNEFGKSTLFDAVQALFFTPHGSRARDIVALRPHAGGAPEVSVEVETDEGRFVLAKRWLSKPSATVTQDGRLIAQADAAEDWIGALLGGGEGEPSGLVWVRQGMTQFASAAKKDQDAALVARRDLMHAVGEEVETMTGGRRMDHALTRCREELGLYATGKNRTPRKSGPWKAALDRVEILTAERDDLAETARRLHEALDARRRAKRALDELEDPDEVADRQERLKGATEAFDAARRHAEAVEAEARKVEAARISVSNVRGRLETLRAALAERQEATDEASLAAEASAAAAAERDAAQDALDVAEDALEAAKRRVTECETARREAARLQAARDGAERRKELAARIERAEAARRDMESAAAAAKRGPDPEALRELEKLLSEVATAKATRDAAATQVTMSYAAGRDGTVRMGGKPLDDGRAVPVTRHVSLEIEGVGQLDLRPAAGPDDGRVERAEAALRGALDRIGAGTMAEAREASAARTEAERRHGEAKAVLASLAVDGIEPLRAALAAIPEVSEDSDGPDLPEAEAALDDAGTARVAAQAARDAAAERLSDSRTHAARTETALGATQDRRARSEDSVERLGDVTEAQLEEEFGKARAALETAEALHAETAREAPDLAGAEAALARARSVDEKARADIARLRPELATLEERISRGSGDAVEERLAETEAELALAEADLARIAHEVKVLERLEAALEAAKTGSRELLFEPVVRELKPLLHLLWPDAELTWDDGDLLPSALVRKGEAEPVEILSGGTQEQVALLVRLAFARMLAAAGRHAPVILDDALVFTDDDRIEQMFTALHRQAADLQIIVLSCRQRAFRALGGQTLRLAEVSAGDVAR